MLLGGCGGDPGNSISLDDALGTAFALVQPADAPPVSSFENGDIIEASGIQRSLRIPGLFWVHNDSGGDSSVFATDAAGRNIGRIHLPAYAPTDWEEISAFMLDGKAFLALGDIGDNASRRDDLSLEIFPEPHIEQLPTGFDLAIDDFSTIALRYADGSAHDCESMAIDAARDQILVVTKDFVDPNAQSLWAAPLRASLATGAALLEFQTALVGLDASPLTLGSPGNLLTLGNAGYATTGMDIRPDGGEVAILTYDQVYLWHRNNDESWGNALNREPSARLAVPAEGSNQAEGIGYSPDGNWLLVVAEHNLAAPPPSTISVIRREPQTMN